MRIVVDPPLGPRDPDLLQRLERARLGFLLRDVLVEQDSLDDLGADLVHRVQRGHRILEDHRDVVAADLAQTRRRIACSRSSPRKSARPSLVADFLGFSPMIVRQVTLLPEPDSPTMPSVLPSLDRERDAVDRLHDPVVRLEVGLEVVDLEERLRHQLRRMRGSMKA